MTRGLLCRAVVVFSCVSPALAAVPDRAAAGAVALTIAVDEGCGARDRVLGVGRQEADRIWAAANVRLVWTTLAGLPYRTPLSEWLVVRCTSEPPSRARRESRTLIPVAAIRFIGALPTNTIVVDLANAELLLQRDGHDARDLDQRFRFVRERRLGRMVGRAVAHEIGHFLTRSGAHTETGLMRASHSVAAFTGESLDPFRVDRVRLGAPLSARASLAPPPPGEVR